MSYGLLWLAPVAVLVGLAATIDSTFALIAAGALGCVLVWRLAAVGLYADQDRLVVRTVKGRHATPWSEITELFWRAPRYMGGASSQGLDTRGARLGLRRTDGTELRVPAFVASAEGAARVDDRLREWTTPAGIAITPLVTRDLRRPE